MNSETLNKLEIVHGTYEQYLSLAHYHYIDPNLWPAMQIYIIRYKNKHTDIFNGPLGVVVYKKPIADIRPRRYATKGYFKLIKDKSKSLETVNKKILYLARIIIDPRYQRQGLASWLLSETLKLQTVPIIETLTPIDFTYKLFVKNGFVRYLCPAPSCYVRFTKYLNTIGISEHNLTNPMLVHNRFINMNEKTKTLFEKEIKMFLSHFKNPPTNIQDINRTKYALSKLPYPSSYLIWFNPRVPSYDFDRAEIEQKMTGTTQLSQSYL